MIDSKRMTHARHHGPTALTDNAAASSTNDRATYACGSASARWTGPRARLEPHTGAFQNIRVMGFAGLWRCSLCILSRDPARCLQKPDGCACPYAPGAVNHRFAPRITGHPWLAADHLMLVAFQSKLGSIITDGTEIKQFKGLHRLTSSALGASIRAASTESQYCGARCTVKEIPWPPDPYFIPPRPDARDRRLALGAGPVIGKMIVQDNITETFDQ